jgi:hypothetical protein
MTSTQAKLILLRRAFGSSTDAGCARLWANIMTSDQKLEQQMRDRDIENNPNCLCADEILRWRAMHTKESQ